MPKEKNEGNSDLGYPGTPIIEETHIPEGFLLYGDNDEPSSETASGESGLNSLAFFKKIAGTWTLDPSGSAWPENGPTGELKGDVTLKMDANGGFAGDLPKVTAHQVGMDIDISATVAGSLQLKDFDSQTRSYTVEPVNVHFTKMDITLSNGSNAFGIGFLVRPILDVLLGNLVITGKIWISAEDGNQSLYYQANDVVQKFSRPYLTGKIIELSFLNDHALLHKNANVAGPYPIQSHGNVGDLIRRPHWSSNSPPNAATFTCGVKIRISVIVVVEPKGRAFKVYGIDSSQLFFHFSSGTNISTGEKQEVELTANMPLPGMIQVFKTSIIWNIVTADGPEEWANIGTTGMFKVYALHAEPIEYNSSLEENKLTQQRLETVIEGINLTKPSPCPNDVHQIASRIQMLVNNKPNLATGKPVNVSYTKDEVNGIWPSNELWRLLDKNSTLHGHCGEATGLMELMCGQLGIKGKQVHVYGNTDKTVFDREENLSYATPEMGKANHTPMQSRHCKVHGIEVLKLNFSSTISKINDGEGCLLVDGKLYPGLIKNATIVGVQHENVKASHHLLLQLEQLYSEPGDFKFQVWTHASDVCKLPEAESGGGPWTIAVPAAK